MLYRSSLFRLGFFAVFALATVWGQGTASKDTAAAYPVHRSAPGIEFGAEYLVHSMLVPSGAIFVGDYLVIEVAAYPATKEPVRLSSAAFTLRINGGKQRLYPQAPGMVAASIKYPDWRQRPAVIGSAGAGDGSIVVGRPSHPGRFPGDPTADGRGVPPRPQAPEPENPTGETPAQAPPIDELCQRLALPEEIMNGPRSGYLFFAYSGKTKNIRSLELIYEGQDGTTATLALR